MKISIKTEDIKIIDDINKYDLNKNNIYNLLASLGEFKQNYDQNLKNLKDLFICQLLSTNYKNFTIFVNLDKPISDDKLLKISESYDILIDFKHNYDVFQFSKNIIILDFKIINYLKNYFLKRIDKITFNLGSNKEVNIKMLDEFLSLLSEDGKLIFDITKYDLTLYDEKVNYTKIFIDDPENPYKICIDYDTTDFSSFIFGRKFLSPNILTTNDLLDYKDIYCFLKDRYNKYDFNLDIKIFDLSIDIDDSTKVDFIRKFKKDDIDKYCEDDIYPVITKPVNSDEQFEFKKEVIMDFEFIKPTILDNFSFLKKSIRKDDTLDVFSEFKSYDLGFGTNVNNSEKMAYIIFTRSKVDSKKLISELKETYFKDFMKVFTHTENLCKNELEYLKEKKEINDTEEGRLQKSLIEFRGYY